MLSIGALLALLLVSGSDAPGVTPHPHVRSVVPHVRALIDDTLQRSPVVRALGARLACSDVIVYVEITATPQVPTARTKLVITSGATRFLRIGLNAGVPNAALGPLLAHELQHAVEIAEHEDVRDEPAVRRLYLRIGRSTGDDAFETDAAQEVEAVVRRELRRRIGG
jgi:hypothetical protein